MHPGVRIQQFVPCDAIIDKSVASAVSLELIIPQPGVPAMAEEVGFIVVDNI